MSFESDMAAAYGDSAPESTAAAETGTQPVTTGMETASGADNGDSVPPHTETEAEPAETEPEPEPSESEKAEKQPQSREENRRQAAQRRQREMQQAVNAEVQRQMDAFYARQYAGKSGTDGKPITTMEAAQAYEQAQSDEADKNAFLDMGMSEEYADKMASAMKRLSELEKQEAARQKVAAAQQELAMQQENDRAVAQQIAALNKAFPSCGIRNADQLFTSENTELLQKATLLNGDLTEAYKLIHWDEIVSGNTAAARQAAINAARSGEHLHGIKASGGDAEDGMTEELYDMYNKFGYTREEAAAAHKRLHASQKRR